MFIEYISFDGALEAFLESGEHVVTTSSSFGNTDAIENMLGPRGDDSTALGRESEYFGPMVEVLEKKYGYESYSDLMAAPYDWRYAPGKR